MNRIKFSILLSISLCQVSCQSSDGGMSKGLLGAATGGLLGALVGDNLLGGDGNSSGGSTTTTAGAGGTTTTTSGGSGGNSAFDDNKGLITGAVAGYAAGSLTEMFAKDEARQKYLDGYNKGRSDAIKELYWVKRDAERPSAEQTVQRRYYEVPVPEHITTDGVLVAPHKRVIEVVE